MNAAVTLLLLSFVAAVHASDQCVYAAPGTVALPTDWVHIAIVMGIPTLSWMVGIGVFVFVSIPQYLLACTQNLSAGILLAAIGNELFPLLKCGSPAATHAPGTAVSYLGLLLGFSAGCIFMFGVDQFVDGLDEEDEGDHEQSEDLVVVSPVVKPVESDALMRHRSMSKEFSCEDPTNWKEFQTKLEVYKMDVEALLENTTSVEKVTIEGDRDQIDSAVHSLGTVLDLTKRHLRYDGVSPEITQADRSLIKVCMAELKKKEELLKGANTSREALQLIEEVEVQLERLHDHNERPGYKEITSTWKNPLVSVALVDRKPTVKEDIPWGHVVAICVDGMMDGLLIGLAYAASTSAGLSMAIATSIEMGFLGLSFSATIKASTTSANKHILIAITPGILMFIVGMLAYVMGAALTAMPAIFIGFIAFAVVALLYLVTQELLVEARAVSGDKDVAIRVMFFVGTYVGLMLDRLVHTDWHTGQVKDVESILTEITT